MQTFRFDKGAEQGVEVSNSKGVVGYTHHEGSLYVYLDSAVEEPIIAIAQNVKNTIPYLNESNWECWNLRVTSEEIRFTTKGWGKLESTWQMPQSGTYQLTMIDAITNSETPLKKFSTDDRNTITIQLPFPQNTAQKLKITRVES